MTLDTHLCKCPVCDPGYHARVEAEASEKAEAAYEQKNHQGRKGEPTAKEKKYELMKTPSTCETVLHILPFLGLHNLRPGCPDTSFSQLEFFSPPCTEEKLHRQRYEISFFVLIRSRQGSILNIMTMIQRRCVVYSLWRFLRRQEKGLSITCHHASSYIHTLSFSSSLCHITPAFSLLKYLSHSCSFATTEARLQ